MDSFRRNRELEKRNLRRELDQANDIESIPGPRRSQEKTKSKLRRSKSSAVDSGVSSDSSRGTPTDSSLPGEEMDKKQAATEHGYDAEKIAQLEGNILQLQSQLASVDVNVERLLVSVETLRPVYNEAKAALSKVTVAEQLYLSHTIDCRYDGQSSAEEQPGVPRHEAGQDGGEDSLLLCNS